MVPPHDWRVPRLTPEQSAAHKKVACHYRAQLQAPQVCQTMA